MTSLPVGKLKNSYPQWFLTVGLRIWISELADRKWRHGQVQTDFLAFIYHSRYFTRGSLTCSSESLPWKQTLHIFVPVSALAVSALVWLGEILGDNLWLGIWGSRRATVVSASFTKFSNFWFKAEIAFLIHKVSSPHGVIRGHIESLRVCGIIFTGYLWIL